MAFRMNRLPDGFTDEIANGGFWRKAAVSDAERLPDGGLPTRPSPMHPGPERRSPGEAATERPTGSPASRRQAFPQAAWSHAQGAGWRTGTGLSVPSMAKPGDGNDCFHEFTHRFQAVEL
jgi:hypothetical protein